MAVATWPITAPDVRPCASLLTVGRVRTLCLACTNVVVVTEISAGDGLSRWQTFGERAIYESPEVRLGQVDVGLPSRERVWHHVVRLHRAVASS